MAARESTTDIELPPPTPPPKDSSPSSITEPSLIKQIDRERDQLSKAFGVCITLKHALMYSDGDMEMNSHAYSETAKAAADIIDSIHYKLERIMDRVKAAEAMEQYEDEEGGPGDDD